MTRTRGRSDDPGRLALDGESVSYVRRGETAWTVPLRRIRVIGEHTTDGGPWDDDSFLVLVAGAPFELMFAPVEAEGTLLDELSRRLGAPLRHGLADRTDFSSRILWPAELSGRPLFDVRPGAPRPGVAGRALDLLIPRVDLVPTDEVRTLAEGPVTDGGA